MELVYTVGESFKDDFIINNALLLSNLDEILKKHYDSEKLILFKPKLTVNMDSESSVKYMVKDDVLIISSLFRLP